MAANSSSRRSYYTGKKRGSSSGSSGLGRIIAIVLVLAVLVACKDDKILCRECAESDHALEILTGKSLEDFKRPLFGSNGD